MLLSAHIRKTAEMLKRFFLYNGGEKQYESAVGSGSWTLEAQERCHRCYSKQKW